LWAWKVLNGLTGVLCRRGEVGYFFPLYTGMTIPYTSWPSRMWLDSWI
jgi:hypothetical protein